MSQEKTIEASEVPQLIVQLRDGEEVHHLVLGRELSIGRDPSNRIPIADHFVSKFHAKLLVSEEGFSLVDLGSSNKTLVNGREISKAAVRYGDEIRFANVKCRLEPPRAQKRAANAPAFPGAPAALAVSPPAVPPVAAPVPSKPTPKPAASGIGRAPIAAPKVPTNPMTRLYIIGGFLIGIALALGVLLRVLLVPSEETSGAQVGSSSPAAATSSVAAAGEPVAPPELEAPSPSVQEPTPPRIPSGRVENKAERHFRNAREAFDLLRYNEAIAEWEMFLALVDPSDARHAEAQEGIEQAQAKLR